METEMMNLEDIVNSVTFLPLETDDDFIIGSISKILKTDSLYYILDKQTQTVFIYDTAGKAVQKISHRGYGAGEYIGIEDFTVTANHIILVCVPSKLMFYNKESLKPENEFKIAENIYYYKMVEWKNNILLCDYNSGKVDRYYDGKIDSVFSWNILKGYIPSSTPAFYICGDKLYFHASGDDIIYSVDSDLKFSPYLVLNYERKKQAIDFYSAREPEPIENLRDIADYPLVDVDNIFQNKRGLVFSYSFAGLFRISYIDNDNTRVHKLSNISVRTATFSNNTLISWTYPFEIDLKRFEGIDVKNYSDNLSKHDNPVLLVYELKNYKD
jgi:hypothetical protein